MRIYIDGVFDLFHRGHLEALKSAKNLYNDSYLIVGIVSDKDAESYKRKPIINEVDRVEIIKNLKMVDDVIFPCPMTPTKEFIEENKIDLVVHGFADEKDWKNQEKYFEEIIKLGKFKKTNYYNKCSTTDIIKKIKLLE